ncbi:MAG: hypothetical protein ACT4P4_19520 [Betaproteobacteria bacterium]
MRSIERVDPARFGEALARLGVTGGRRGFRTYEAARLVLCEAMRPAEVGRMMRLSGEGIRKAVAKVRGALAEQGACPHCGQPWPKQREDVVGPF